MKSTAWLRVMVVFVVLMGLAGALLRWALQRPDDDWKGLALNLVTELAGAALLYFLFELVIGRMERREAEKEELEAKKADLIAQMGSQVQDVAIAAAEELRRHGWLRDGSLQGANLIGANLEGANLFRADLQEADLMMANLQRAYLVNAFLQKATLSATNLQTASLDVAHLQTASLSKADLREARLSQGTTLPDGTNWTPDTDMARFTNPDHPDFWRPGA